MEPGGEARRGAERREDEEEEEERGGSGSSGDSEPEPPACRSRRVSFADAFGLNLVSVKEFCTVAGEPPPPDDDDYDDDDDDDDGGPPEPDEYFLRSQFSVPASAAELLAKLETQRCELESVELLPGTATVRGIVRVLNLCYYKAVCVRATLDGWASWFDLPADFVPGSSDGKTDRFAFSLRLAAPVPPDGARVEFCLRYQTPLGTFWANNSGVNYVLFCQQRGGRDRKGGRCEDPNRRNKKSCLKINSKEKPTDPNTPVISAGNADGPLNEQEADVSKKTEEPAPNSDGLQDDSCQKSLVESGRNVSRRTRRRVARLAQIRDRFRYSRDSQSSEDTDSPVMWDWSQRGRKEQVESDGETLQQSAEVEPEALLLALTYAATANTTPDGPRENGQDLGEMSTDVETRGTTRAFESVEDGQASGCATAGGGEAFPTAFWDSGAPLGTVWDPTALQRTLWCPDIPQGAPWDSQGVLAESAAILSEVASGQESSPRGREEEPSRQTQAADDIIASERGYLRADIADVKDEDRQRSRTIGRDGARTDSHRAGLDWPRGERAGGNFKFETFVAPLYHQASCRRRPESQDVGGGGQWEGVQASDDEDDEDGHDRLSAIANAPRLFPFGSYAPPVHPLQTSGAASSPRDDSPSADTHAPRPGQPGYGQEDRPPRQETGDPAAEVMAVEQVAGYGAEIILDRRVPRGAGIVRQDEELLFAANAVERTQILGDAETKTDATAMIAALAPSNADVSRLTLLSAHPETENKQYDLRGDRVTFTQAFRETGGDFTEGEGQVVREKPKNQGVSRRNEEERGKISEIPMGSEKEITDFMDGDTEGMRTEKEASLDEGQIVSAEQEEEFNKTEVLSAGNQGLPGECLVKNEELDYEVSPEDAELLSVENEDPDDEVTVEGEDIDDAEVLLEDKEFDDDDDVSVEDEDLDDEEVSVEDEDLDDAMLVEEEDLDGDKVSVEGDDLNKNISLENNNHSGDNLNENKDFHNEDLSVKDAELVQDVSVENEHLDDDEVPVEDEEFNKNISVENYLHGDNLNENEDLENEELPIEDPELAEDVSLEHDHKDYDEVSVEEEAGKYTSVGDEEPARDKSMENKDPYVENLTENDDRLSVENNDLDNKLSLKDEDLDEEAPSMENGDRIDEAGEEAPVGMDPEELTSETSTGKKDYLYDRGEVFFIERKDEHRDGGNDTVKEREDLEEGVEAVFGGQDLKTDVLIRGDIHLHTDRTAAGAETESDVKDMEEVYREEGKSVEGGGPPGGENPDREAEEDSVSADSLTDDEMELHMRSVNSAHKQQLARGAPGNSRTPPLGGAKRPSSSRARAPLATLSSISESLDEDEDEDVAEEESDLPPEETPGDHDAIEPLPVEKADDAAATYPSSCEESAILGRLGRAVLYALLCVLFFVTAYHHDFLACFALYLFSVFWLCFHGEKQRLQDANRAE